MTSPTGASGPFTAIIQRDGKWWVGWVAEVPGVASQGESRDELMENLSSALREALEFNRADAAAAAAPGHEVASISA